MKETVIEKIAENKLIVIVRGVEREKLIPLAEALYEGGVRLLEITYSANKSVADVDTAANIKLLADHFEGRMLIGAGTVLSEEQVELTAKAGGKFIISPDTNERVIRKTCELGLVSIPGALTPTEIQSAHSFGADFVKLFPITNMGTAYVKAVKAPLSHIKLLAVGGINADNAADFIKSGVCGIGAGGNLVNKDWINAGEWDKITALASEFIKNIRG
ncbi:MAG: bifunctional 4-hydroxy-2-oxoglutarate aldolase/2-dehydro-3-deoxy-phosphogluconate aldolase [Clostridia bacterium]|nr:bifunctional 4-hydroxy-2-oxoglutarate aldolase/2-dehydro-3-deoxy-phosphogluconate aldolase [Clostridia bacterium]